jgi:hypothetical protein
LKLLVTFTAFSILANHARSPGRRAKFLPYLPKTFRAGQAGSDIDKTELDSTPKTKSRNQVLIAALVVGLQIIQESPPMIDHAQQSSTGVMILLVRAEVLGELVDSSGQQRNLDFRRTCVLRAATEFSQNLGFTLRT